MFLCERGSVYANLVNVTLTPHPPLGLQITIFIVQTTLLRVMRAFLTIYLLAWSSKLNFKVLKQLKQRSYTWHCPKVVILGHFRSLWASNIKMAGAFLFLASRTNLWCFFTIWVVSNQKKNRPEKSETWPRIAHSYLQGFLPQKPFWLKMAFWACVFSKPRIF